MYLYHSHLGGIYLTEEQQDLEDLYCEECGDSDWELGQVETFEDVLDCITDSDGFVPYTDEYLAEIKAELEAEVE